MVAANLALFAVQMQPFGLVRHLDDGDVRLLIRKFGIRHADAERIAAQIDVAGQVDFEAATLAEAGFAILVPHQTGRLHDR